MVVEVHAFDLVTGTPIGRLDVKGLSWSEQLNAQMKVDCKLDLAHRPSSAIAESLLPGRTKLVVYDPATIGYEYLTHDGEIVTQDDNPVITTNPGVIHTGSSAKSFILMETSYTSRRFLHLRGVGLWSWFNQFPLSRDFTFNRTEQHQIAATLIEWAQSPSQGGGIGVEVDWSPSGRVRDREYNAFEYTAVGQRVNELAAVIDGFDFAIDTTFDGNVTVTETWRPSYPRAGTAWPASGVQIDADHSAVQLDMTNSAPVTHVREIGAGEGDAMLTATATDATLTGYPPLWHIPEARKSVSRQATLQGHADRDLQLVNRATEVWSATIADAHHLLKTVTVGDECRIVLGPDDYRYSDGLTVVRRVVGRSVTVPDDGGPDRVQLELEESDI